jgi:hypothetical protein
MRRTCNRGLTNPEYKSTPQDLIDKRVEETPECRLKGFKIRL